VRYIWEYGKPNKSIPMSILAFYHLLEFCRHQKALQENPAMLSPSLIKIAHIKSGSNFFQSLPIGVIFGIANNGRVFGLVIS